jgi:hypothetical protein
LPIQTHATSIKHTPCPAPLPPVPLSCSYGAVNRHEQATIKAIEEAQVIPCPLDLDAIEFNQGTSSRLEQLRSRRHQTERLAVLALEANLIPLSRKLTECGRDFQVLECVEDGRRFIRSVGNRCNNRLCSRCASRRSGVLSERYRPVVEALAEEGNRLRFITLTVPNRATLTREWIKDIQAAVTKLRRQSWFKTRVIASLSAIEVKRSEGEGKEWHPHVHILVVGPANGFIDYETILNAWNSLTGSQNVQVKKADVDSVSEVIKYIAKASTIETAEDLTALYRATKGVRMLTATGKLRGINSEVSEDDLDADEQAAEAAIKATATKLTLVIIGEAAWNSPTLDALIESEFKLSDALARVGPQFGLPRPVTLAG